jgi:cytochrome c-type biogenesis protein CcmH
MALFFSFIAGVLAGGAAVRVALPLCRNAAALARRRGAYVRAGAFVASFAVAAGILYFASGARHGLERPATTGPASAGAAASGGEDAGRTAKSMDADVARLEARLAREGGTPPDWTLLAQAYDFLGRPEDAKRARAKAGNPPSGPPVWQMGAGALTAAAAATDRSTSATGPAGSMPAAAAPTKAPAGASAATAVPTGTVTAPAGAASNVEVSGTVSVDARLAHSVQPDATLFIYAKAADSPGPPLAIVRAAVRTWPVNFRLDDSKAMIPSRRLSQFDRVVIEARISRRGQATPAAGDLYVTSQVLHPAAGTRLALVINREIG